MGYLKTIGEFLVKWLRDWRVWAVIAGIVIITVLTAYIFHVRAENAILRTKMEYQKVLDRSSDVLLKFADEGARMLAFEARLTELSKDFEERDQKIQELKIQSQMALDRIENLSFLELIKDDPAIEEGDWCICPCDEIDL